MEMATENTECGTTGKTTNVEGLGLQEQNSVLPSFSLENMA